jgi:hypothetical protein
MSTYGVGPYTKSINTLEKDIADALKRVNEVVGALYLDGWRWWLCEGWREARLPSRFVLPNRFVSISRD